MLKKVENKNGHIDLFIGGHRIISYKNKKKVKQQDIPLILNDDIKASEGKKNIIVIAPNKTMLKALLSDDNIFIPVLVTGSHNYELRDLIEKNKRKIGRIYNMYPVDYNDFFSMVQTDYELDFLELKEYRDAQFKVDRFMNRHLLDLNEVDYRYILALRFWLGIFEKYDIDLIISGRVEHGDLNDAILYAIAEKKRIPSYIFSIEYANSEVWADSVRKYDGGAYTAYDLKRVINDKAEIDLSRYVHDKKCGNRENVRAKEKKYKQFFDALSKKLKKENKSCKGMKGADAFHYRTDMYKSWNRQGAKQEIEEFNYVRNLLKTYNKISVQADFDKKYVFYALHFEPEASILNRGKISNQLFIIKMLSENLPDGWMLYVKEHPMQFAMYNDDITYCFCNVDYFRTEQFYAQILRMKNTKLIDIETSSEDLIKNAQAVATIQGTVCLEAIVRQKPLFVFSDNTTIMGKIDDVFTVNSENDVKKYMQKLSSGFVPAYKNLDKITNSYLIENKYVKTEEDEIKSENVYRQIIKSLTAKK